MSQLCVVGTNFMELTKLRDRPPDSTFSHTPVASIPVPTSATAPVQTATTPTVDQESSPGNLYVTFHAENQAFGLTQ
jgi:hypothetical protein